MWGICSLRASSRRQGSSCRKRRATSNVAPPQHSRDAALRMTCPVAGAARSRSCVRTRVASRLWWASRLQQNLLCGKCFQQNAGVHPHSQLVQVGAFVSHRGPTQEWPERCVMSSYQRVIEHPAGSKFNLLRMALPVVPQLPPAMDQCPAYNPSMQHVCARQGQQAAYGRTQYRPN